MLQFKSVCYVFSVASHRLILTGYAPDSPYGSWGCASRPDAEKMYFADQDFPDHSKSMLTSVTVCYFLHNLAATVGKSISGFADV
jgi:hypothetical protein